MEASLLPPRTKVKVNRKKRVEQPTLFPGHLLNSPVKTLQYGACVIGNVFEKVTERVLGGSSRQTTDSMSSLCPDVANEEINMIAESKAFGMNKSHRNARCMMEHKQLDNYARQAEYKQVIYCVWNYSHPKPVGCKPKDVRVGMVIDRVISSLECGYIMDLSIILRLRELEKKYAGVAYRHARLYFIGRGVIYREYMILYRRVFEEMRTDTAAFLVRIGLDPALYNWRQQHRQVRFSYDGVDFRTRRFKLFTVARIPEETPF